MEIERCLTCDWRGQEEEKQMHKSLVIPDWSVSVCPKCEGEDFKTYDDGYTEKICPRCKKPFKAKFESKEVCHQCKYNEYKANNRERNRKKSNKRTN